MPHKRNAVEIDGEAAVDVKMHLRSPVPPGIGYTPEEVFERRRVNSEIGRIKSGDLAAAILRYEWSRDENGKLICPAKCCHRQFGDFEENILHISQKSWKSQSCMLYPRNAKFNWRSHRGLNLHVATHLPPTVRCPVEGCTYVTTHSRNLKIHEKVHNGFYQDEANLKHTCEHCEMKFVVKSDLRKHEETHNSDRKTLTCACGSKFARDSNLRTHQRDSCKLRTTDAQHKCPECFQSFRTYDALGDHRLKAHAQRNQAMG
jgi:C2H2-type zinc finger/Zinc finger, C2H2 type